MHVGERVQLSDHTSTRYYFWYGPAEPVPAGEIEEVEARQPGWYNYRGFRTHTPVEISGPHATFKDALVADARYRMQGYMQYEMALTASKPLEDHGALIINRSSLRLGTNVRIDGFTKLECGEGMLIGNDVHIASFAHLGIGGGLTILEDGSAFASGAKIITGSNVPALGRSCSAVDPSAKFSRSFCIVGRNAIMFAGAIALPGVVIGENAVLAAGAVATKDVPANSIFGGVPARKIGEVQPDQPVGEQVEAAVAKAGSR